MIGSIEIAREGATMLDEANTGPYELSDADCLEVPEGMGWRYLGAGASRLALLHEPTNVVYKFGLSYDNVNEARNSRRLRSLKSVDSKYYIPRSRNFRLGNIDLGIGFVGKLRRYVLATEFAEAAITSENMNCCGREWYEIGYHKLDEWCWVGVIQSMRKDLGIFDVHQSNYIYATDGRYWMIDLGEDNERES